MYPTGVIAYRSAPTVDNTQIADGDFPAFVLLSYTFMFRQLCVYVYNMYTYVCTIYVYNIHVTHNAHIVLLLLKIARLTKPDFQVITTN